MGAGLPPAVAAVGLRTLTAGWGFSASLLRGLCSTAGVRLTSLQLSVGASVTDELLSHVAVSCNALQRLCLKLAAVSDAGAQVYCMTTCVIVACVCSSAA